MMPPGTLVNAIRSALAFVILLECFASFLSLATLDEMPKADKATIKITERRKSLGFMIQVRLILFVPLDRDRFRSNESKLIRSVVSSIQKRGHLHRLSLVINTAP